MQISGFCRARRTPRSEKAFPAARGDLDNTPSRPPRGGDIGRARGRRWRASGRRRPRRRTSRRTGRQGHHDQENRRSSDRGNSRAFERCRYHRSWRYCLSRSWSRDSSAAIAVDPTSLTRCSAIGRVADHRAVLGRHRAVEGIDPTAVGRGPSAWLAATVGCSATGRCYSSRSHRPWPTSRRWPGCR